MKAAKPPPATLWDGRDSFGLVGRMAPHLHGIKWEVHRHKICESGGFLALSDGGTRSAVSGREKASVARQCSILGLSARVSRRAASRPTESRGNGHWQKSQVAACWSGWKSAGNTGCWLQQTGVGGQAIDFKGLAAHNNNNNKIKIVLLLNLPPIGSLALKLSEWLFRDLWRNFVTCCQY